METIYFDNNATTKMDEQVLEEMKPFFCELYGNPSSMHTFGGQIGRRIGRAREQVAELIGCEPNEIIFTSGGTESDNTAIKGTLAAAPNKRKIITARVEHPAVLAVCREQENHGYAVIELNPQTVRRELARQEPIHFGDATNEAVLMKAGVANARAAAVVIGDAAATRGAVAHLRRLNPCLHIIARTRFMAEVEHLYELGANDVVPEEFETSVAIFRRTAQHFDLPDDYVQRLEETIREDHYAMLRGSDEYKGCTLPPLSEDEGET